MNTPTVEEHGRSVEERTKELNETSRHFFYIRIKDIPFPPSAMDALEVSIKKHMANFKVEFEDNNEKMHITLPPGEYTKDSFWLHGLRRELDDALDMTKLSTFFVHDPIRSIEFDIEVHKKLLSQFRDSQKKRGGEEDNIRSEEFIISMCEVQLKDLLERSQG
ncbi:hypothetical protein FGADI_7537 [Fusarium gaditjirri]|uniref:Uncharacterized protein n=1 Tax=Fusarium gaditjirri TaxID=282569 RepID=A0A8H4T4Z0_9HYPO|nr:hypothetical protein FGADI_7537 [Fusarium gaditjirri]